MPVKGWSYEEGMRLPQLLEELHAIFSEDSVDTDRVDALLRAYKSDPHDWRQYTRNLVDAGNGKFNLMILCWGEGMGSSVHDHADAHCFVKVLEGQLLETQFEWPEEGKAEGPLGVKEEALRKTGSVCYMSDAIGLHRIENPSHSEGAVSLHLYIPPFTECRSFDQRTGHANSVKMTFWSSGGVRSLPSLSGAQAPNTAPPPNAAFPCNAPLPSSA